METIGVVLMFGLVTATIGAIVGENKGNGNLGFILGFFFSVLGILIVAVMPETDKHKKEKIEELDEIEGKKVSKAKELLGIDYRPDEILKIQLSKLETLKTEGILLEDEYLEARKSIISKYL